MHSGDFTEEILEFVRSYFPDDDGMLTDILMKSPANCNHMMKKFNYQVLVLGYTLLEWLVIVLFKLSNKQARFYLREGGSAQKENCIKILKEKYNKKKRRKVR